MQCDEWRSLLLVAVGSHTRSELMVLCVCAVSQTMRVWQKRVLDATNEQKAAADGDAAGEGETDA